MSAVEKFQNLIAEQAPKLAAIPRSCRQLDPAISGAACGTNDIGSSHARQPSIMEPVVLREGKGKIPEIKSDLTEFTASRDLKRSVRLSFLSLMGKEKCAVIAPQGFFPIRGSGCGLSVRWMIHMSLYSASSERRPQRMQ